MASVRENSQGESKKGASVDLHRAGNNGRSGPRAHPITLAELAELMRELHQSLEDYAPTWYTKSMDDRIRKTLAAADCSRSAFHY